MRNFLGLLFLGIILVTSCRSGVDDVGSKNGTDTTRMVLKVLDQRIEDDAKNPELYHQRARYYMSTHDFDKALKDIRQAISFDPGKGAYYVTLSDIYLLTGKPDNCKESLTKAAEVDPKNTDAKLKLAKLFLIMKDYPNCFTTLRDLFVLDPGNSSGYYTRAIALLEKGDTAKAVSDLQKAVENDQQNYDAYVQLGELYSMKKNALAEMYLKNALNLKPRSKEALYMLGMYYQETGMYDKAIITYRNLSQVDTAFREPSYNIGYIYLVYLKDFPKAITFFTESLKKDPGNYKAWYNRGYAYELAGDYQKASDDYQKTLKLQVNYEKAVAGLNRLDRLKIR